MAPENADGSILIVALDGQVAAVDSFTGQVLWNNKLVSGGLGIVALAIEGDVIYASAEGARLFALDYWSGRICWSVATSKVGRATIGVEKEKIFIAKAGVIDCYDKSGKHLWTQELKGMGIGRISMGFPGRVIQIDGERG